MVGCVGFSVYIGHSVSPLFMFTALMANIGDNSTAGFIFFRKVQGVWFVAGKDKDFFVCVFVLLML